VRRGRRGKLIIPGRKDPDWSPPTSRPRARSRSSPRAAARPRPRPQPQPKPRGSSTRRLDERREPARGRRALDARRRQARADADVPCRAACTVERQGRRAQGAGPQAQARQPPAGLRHRAKGTKGAVKLELALTARAARRWPRSPARADAQGRHQGGRQDAPPHQAGRPPVGTAEGALPEGPPAVCEGVMCARRSAACPPLLLRDAVPSRGRLAHPSGPACSQASSSRSSPSRAKLGTGPGARLRRAAAVAGQAALSRPRPGGAQAATPKRTR
jgi:hypothetical protein